MTPFLVSLQFQGAKRVALNQLSPLGSCLQLPAGKSQGRAGRPCHHLHPRYAIHKFLVFPFKYAPHPRSCRGSPQRLSKEPGVHTTVRSGSGSATENRHRGCSGRSLWSAHVIPGHRRPRAIQVPHHPQRGSWSSCPGPSYSLL